MGWKLKTAADWVVQHPYISFLATTAGVALGAVGVLFGFIQMNLAQAQTEQMETQAERAYRAEGQLEELIRLVNELRDSPDESLREELSDLDEFVEGIEGEADSSPSSVRYKVEECGAILDRNTGLEWFVGPDDDFPWNGAQAWVNDLAACGGGWRMPSPEELMRLHEPEESAGIGYLRDGVNYPARIASVFDGIGSGSWVWTREEGLQETAVSVNLHENVEVLMDKNQTRFPVRAFAVR